MKKILLIEDNETKRRTLLNYLTESGVPIEQVIVAKSMTDFAANLNADIGLFIIDLKLPSIDDVAASQNGKAILEAIIKAGKGDALLVAISSYPKDFPSCGSSMSRTGASYRTSLIRSSGNQPWIMY